MPGVMLLRIPPLDPEYITYRIVSALEAVGDPHDKLTLARQGDCRDDQAKMALASTRGTLRPGASCRGVGSSLVRSQGGVASPGLPLPSRGGDP
ncbi:MAG: hypothetical protein GSR80_001088, partial [Desulfurococcales archaeon]|nr:hypothetical protein [Desulfurococcales archaeon]